MTEQEYRSQKVNELYFRIITACNQILENAGLYTVQELKNHKDPSLEERVKKLKFVAAMMQEVATDNFDDLNKATNAFQFALIIEHFLTAVIKEDELKLKAVLVELERHLNTP